MSGSSASLLACKAMGHGDVSVQVSQEKLVLIWGSEVLTEERLSQDHSAIETLSSLFQLPASFLLPPAGFTPAVWPHPAQQPAQQKQGTCLCSEGPSVHLPTYFSTSRVSTRATKLLGT